MIARGTWIAQFVIEAPLGAGGGGTVYRARDEQLERLIALKVVHAGSQRTLAQRQQLLSEARLATTVRHPAVPVVFDVGETTDAVWIAMQLVEGRSLDAPGERGVGAAGAAATLSHIGSALDALHAAGILHRDVKPGNIVRSELGRMYLVDFGIAVASETGSADGHAFVGTPRYAAPERWRGTAEGTHSDVYSLACVTHELLTGRPIFEEADDPASLMMAHLAADPAPLAPALAVMQPVLDRGLAKDPRERYESAGAFTHDLMEASRKARVPWRSPRRNRGAVDRPEVESSYEYVFFAALLVVPGRPDAGRLGARLSDAEPHGEWGMHTFIAYEADTHQLVGTLVSLRAHLPYGEARIGAGEVPKAMHHFLVRLLRALGATQALVQARFHIDDADLQDHPSWSDAAEWVVNGRDVPDDWARLTLAGLLEDGYGGSSADIRDG